MSGEADSPVMPFDAARAFLAEREFAEGWLVFCETNRIFCLPTLEFVAGLQEFIGALAQSPVVELAAGRGSLAMHLRATGVDLVDTDPLAPPGDHLQQVDARQAIECYRPPVVISAFAPFDSDVDPAVLDSDCVRHYLSINAECNGQFGHPRLLTDPSWQRRRLGHIDRYLLTRFDAPVDRAGTKIIHHGQMWHLWRSR